MKPIDCKIENYPTQTGVGSRIMFSWKYGPGKHIQTAYQIDIFQEENRVYSTDKIQSDEQNNIVLDLDLEEQEKYGFLVSAWDENDFREKSEYAHFITGVKKWRGVWIGNGTAKPFVARRFFEAGMSLEEVSVKTQLPLDQVRGICQGV